MNKKQGIVLFLALLTLACGPTAPPAQQFPDAPIIFISIDTLRSDHLPAYGYTKVKTPHIDELANSGVLFKHAYAQAPLTLPSHATMMTGLLPSDHGVRENVGFTLDDSHQTLAETLKQYGYQTGASVSSVVLRSSTGIAQGFDFYGDQLGAERRQTSAGFAERPGAQTVDEAIQWLQTLSTFKLFFWLHLFEPHSPYLAPPEWRGKHEHPYDDEIAYTDHLLGLFFDTLKQHDIYDKAIIVLLSDHGEGLGQHGEAEHGMFVYRPTIQVPLIIKLPDSALAGQEIKEPVGLFDLYPTLLRLLDQKPNATHGMALLDGEAIPSRPIYSEALAPELLYGWHASRSAVQDELHYIEGFKPELFDLGTDPEELNNLYGTRKIPDQATQLIDRIGSASKGSQSISDEDKAMLESLGYTGSFNISDDAKSLTPEQFLQTQQLITKCQKLINEEEYAQAEPLLAQQLARYPSMLDFRNMLAYVLNKQQKHEQAAFLCMEGLAVVPDHPGLMLGLATAQIGQGQFQEAKTVSLKALQTAPELTGSNLLNAFYKAGQFDQIPTLADQLYPADPVPAFLYHALAVIKKEGNTLGIPALLQNLPPTDISHALFTLGDRLARDNQYLSAAQVLQNLIAAEPNHASGRRALAMVQASMRKPQAAIEVLNQWVRDFPTRANYLHAAETMAQIGLKEAAQFYRTQADNYQ